MKRAILTILAGVSLCLAPLASAQDAVFRSNVRLVRMLVTVKDRSGALIGSLNRTDFTVFDNGVKQKIAVFERQTEQPLSVSLLMDCSASTGIEIKYEIDSAARFLNALLREGNPDDTGALYSFDADVTMLAGFTRHFELLERGLRKLHSGGGTSLYDAIFFVSRDLELRQGRHVLIVVTDGGDTTSAKNFHQALEAAQLANTLIYPVIVVPIRNPAGRNIGGEHALITMAAGTGGRVFTPEPGPALDDAFSTILRELRTQYLVGYYPAGIPPTKDRFHTLNVRLGNPDLRVITRSGYYGEFEDSTRLQGR